MLLAQVVAEIHLWLFVQLSKSLLSKCCISGPSLLSLLGRHWLAQACHVFKAQAVACSVLPHVAKGRARETSSVSAGIALFVASLRLLLSFFLQE